MRRPPVAIAFPLMMGLLGITVVLRVLLEAPIGRVQTLLGIQNDTLKSNQFSYRHVIDQLQWISEFSKNNASSC